MAIRLPLLAKPDRRRWTRYWFNGSIQLWNDRRRIDGLGIQVSRGGMYLFAIADLPVGSTIKVAFTEPTSQQRVEALGTVRHRAVYLYGVEFLPHDEVGTIPDSADALNNELRPS